MSAPAVRCPTPRAAPLELLALLALVLAAPSLSGGCATTAAAPEVHVLDARIDKRHRPTFLGLPLATGQVILSEAPGAYSLFFSLVPERFFEFTHAAIIVMEGGEPYVYDMAGDFRAGFYDRPTDGIVGGLRRTPFLEYCRPNLYAEVFDPPAGVDPAKVAAFIHEKRDRGVEFDPYFRYDEHEKLFCTEFVELALEAGGAKPVTLVPTNRNPSIRAAMRYLAVPLDTALPARLYGDDARYVGAVGQFGSRTAAYLYFEAKREIHRRFTSDQKLGNIFALHHPDIRLLLSGGDMLELRPAILDFMLAAVRTSFGERIPEPRSPAIARAVREIADEKFGPFAAEAGAAAGGSGPRPGPSPRG